ncbi:hypothetical protein BDN72DRAFT_849973 [Pluteus cervinus]|uniref:Uncharacterized protein n=1 Tax=Pluteus cervinus TaxID=181527 RepID=A0ACD3A8D3_9AGAR|nr:hypothetical protein BDN72DRAFT_849973 [Pluteus cervinus]
MDSHAIIINLHETSPEGIDAQIRILQDYIRQLHIARNALMPVNCLPAEVLLNIFALAGRRWEMEAGRVMLKITWVSHYWRTLALGSPDLWTVVTNQTLGQTDEWLTRSGSAPLSIGLFNIRPGVLATPNHHFQSLFDEMSRIETLHLTLSPREPDYRTVLDSLWREPAVLLTGLKLGGLNLPRDFPSKIPNVQYLCLGRCQFGWEISTLRLHQLSCLHISTPHTKVSVGQVIELLYGIPTLEYLVLIAVFPPDERQDEVPFHGSPGSESGGPRLHLLELDFRHSINSPLQFLEYILPRFMTGETIVSCSSSIDNAGVLTHLLTSFSQLFSPKRTPSSISFNDTLSINYKDIDDNVCRTSLVIWVNDRPDGTSNDVLSSLQQSLPLMHLRALKCDDELDLWNLDIPRLIETFAVLPKLEYLDVQGWEPDITSFLETLLKAHISTPDYAPPLPFPALKIFGTLLQKESNKVFLKVLKTRKRLGYPLEMVILDGSGSEESLKLKESADRAFGHLVDIVVEETDEWKKIQSVMLIDGVKPVFKGCSVNSFEE